MHFQVYKKVNKHANICNIINKGVFPNTWKMANVTPVHKKNSKQVVNNYRPLSILPIFSKIFEKIVFQKLYNHLVTNNLITTNQSGFRPNDSVTSQLISLVESIHSSLDIELEVRSVYLDMSKAFDKVWHEGLIFKLKQNGIDGKLLSLFVIENNVLWLMVLNLYGVKLTLECLRALS